MGAETLDMAVKTGVSEGAGVATANLANLIRLQGSLTDPTLAVDPLGVARTAVSAGAAIASGGLSLLAEQVITRSADSEDVCAIALGQKAASDPASTSTEDQEAAPGSARDPRRVPRRSERLGRKFGRGLEESIRSLTFSGMAGGGARRGNPGGFAVVVFDQRTRCPRT